MSGKKPNHPAVEEGSRLPRRVAVVAVVLAAAGAVLYGLSRLDDLARRHLGPRDRYEVRFADVQCDTPAGLDRPTFLAEVRYAGDFPESFNLMDDAAQARLAAAFEAHPWVEAVEGLFVEPGPRVTVRLKFRTPVLAVPTEDGGARLVDGGGVLLPVSPVPAGLPELVNVVPPPEAPAGRPWPDALVGRAAELAKGYHPRRLEKTLKGWKLTQPDGKVLTVGG